MTNGKGDANRVRNKQLFNRNFEDIVWAKDKKNCESCLCDVEDGEYNVVTVGLFYSIWCEDCTRLEFERNERDHYRS